MTFNPSTFKTAPDRHAGFGNHMFWGGGHNNETLPTNKGWKARRPQSESQLLLVGQPGVEVCATLLHLEYGTPGTVDVAIYCETPEEIRSKLAKGEYTDAMYHQLPNIPGVGLSVIRLIEEERKQIADYKAQ